MRQPQTSPTAKRAKKGAGADDSPLGEAQSAAGDNAPAKEVELGEEEQLALDEVESEISQLLTTGIQDTSILGNEAECASVWQHIQGRYDEADTTTQDDLGTDLRLRDVVRAFADGSVLSMGALIPELHRSIAAHCKITGGDISDAKLKMLIPLFIARRNLGESFDGPAGSSRMESERSECMWVWESPSTDVFPPGMLESVKAAREARNLLSRRYKTLVKVRDAIRRGDQAARSAANEQLGAIYKKMLLEREKRERMEVKRKSIETKRQQIANHFSKAAAIRETKTANTKTIAPVKTEKSTVKIMAKRPAGGAKPPNMLLNWLKSTPTAPSSTAGGEVGGASGFVGSGVRSVESAVPPTSGHSDAAGHCAEGAADDYDDMGATEEQMQDIAKLMEKLPQNKSRQTRTGVEHRTGSDASAGEDAPEKTVSSNGGFEEFTKMCEDHREAWMRYFTYINTNRKFYVDTSVQTAAAAGTQEEGGADAKPAADQVSKSFVVEDLVNNVRDTIYGDATLRLERGARVFQMSDSEWKRPSMRLVVSRSSHNVKATAPLAIEPAMDYFIDSDEEWFEQYDVDDVDESGSEEEEEEEDENDWIVQDNPQQGPQKHTLNLCEVVKVFCMHRHWHWIVDGVPQNNDECCSVEEAKNNGMSILPCDFGFGYEGYTQNPISDFVSNMRGHRIIMTKEDVQEFLKHCHGKHTKKEALIQEFKELKPFCSTAEIRDKFKKYICRMKVDDTPQRWLVTTEAAMLFGIRPELDAILATAMEQTSEDV
ncbi:uncharacterized protein BcabD6B2_25960 [Babesia caballi]|uniref:Chromatin assembly factor 1 subunit A dimerization domain-containing protein n=1 Tax=Babesia caballi TaxID=5871 RepID=A0AAV4LVN4_BABCB|nr:hypothetical protein, conserved [Babesia caballi]